MAKKLAVAVEISATDKASAKIKAFAAKTKVIMAPIEKIGDMAGTALKGIGLIAGAATAAGYAIERMMSGYVERAGEIHNFSRQIGFGAEALQEWRYAADLADVGVADFDRSLGIFVRTLGYAKAGTGPLLAHMKKMGPEGRALFKALQGKGPEESLEAVIDTMIRLKDPTKAGALAMAAFGSSGQRMVLLALEGKERLAKLREEMRRLGPITAQEAEAAEAFGDAMTRLKYAGMAVVNLIGGELVPVLRPFLDQMREWVAAHKDLIKIKIHEAMTRLGEVLKRVGAWFDEHGAEVWATFNKGLDKAMWAAAWTAKHFDDIVTAVKTLGVLWATGKIAGFLTAMTTAASTMSAALSAMGMGVAAPIAGAAAGAGLGLAINADIERRRIAGEQTIKGLRGQVGAAGYGLAWERAGEAAWRATGGLRRSGITAEQARREFLEREGGPRGRISQYLLPQLQNVAAEQMASKIAGALQGAVKIVVDFQNLPAGANVLRPEGFLGPGVNLLQTVNRMLPETP